MTDIGRRRFLRGEFSKLRKPIRPPWALAEEAFAAACTRCCDCVNGCPEHILILDPAGRPTVDFTRGECTFCRKCLDACRPGALKESEGMPPWPLKARVGSACVARSNVVCRACGDACAAQAIRFRPVVMAAAQPEVNTEICTGCGACVAPCPVQAIRIA